ncbi:MAG: Clp protease/crotonase-like domain-containing protein [Planctomycetota bacterium]|jgi:hypothetical protein
MNTRLLACSILAVFTILGLGRGILAGSDSDAETEDILYMVDGRELHGHILDETATAVTFELIDRRVNIRTKITFSKADISQIHRDVPLEAPAAEPERARKPAGASTTSAPDRTAWGRSRGPADDARLPALYIVPMRGQMGTDIHPSIYEEVAEDIREAKPDVIIFRMNCSDQDDLMIPLNEATERGLFMHHEFRELLDLFKDDLGDFRQVMWIEDSIGFSSLVAMGWHELYMTPTARLGGLRRVSLMAEGWSDTDVAAKMMAAWTGIGKSFLEYGNYAMELGDAMMRPEQKLSASFRGREVVWSLTDAGEYLVDNDKEKTANFNAKLAEDLGVSDGTVENLDDLAFLLGYREYRVISEEEGSPAKAYVEDWRRTFENTKTWWADYFQHTGWATGDETLKWLGRAKNDVERIIRAMERYEAVEIRWRTDLGTQKVQLEILVEQLKEQIRALKDSRGGGVGGRPGGGSPMGPR